VRYGIAPDKLYNTYEVRGKASVRIPSLNRGVKYYVTIDSFGEGGITESGKIYTL